MTLPVFYRVLAKLCCQICSTVPGIDTLFKTLKLRMTQIQYKRLFPLEKSLGGKSSRIVLARLVITLAKVVTEGGRLCVTRG